MSFKNKRPSQIVGVSQYAYFNNYPFHLVSLHSIIWLEDMAWGSNHEDVIGESARNIPYASTNVQFFAHILWLLRNNCKGSKKVHNKSSQLSCGVHAAMHMEGPKWHFSPAHSFRWRM
jgi:hypothetical protein